MGHPRAYPPELARYVIAHWPKDREFPLSQELFLEALSVAFQASLTAEEERPVRFRLLLMPVENLPETGVPNQGVLRLPFDRSRPFTAEELRRLSPSTPFEASLIGIQAEGGRLRIWGIAHSGPAWLAPSWGGRSLVPNWTYDPIIHVAGPGQVTVRCAGKLIGALDAGSIVDATMDVFDSDWLQVTFARQREEVRAEHAALQSRTTSPTFVEQSLVGKVTQQMLRRVITLVRGARHGGIVLFVDTDSATFVEGSPRGLRLKYRFEQGEPSHRYRSLLLQLMRDFAASTTLASVGWEDFVSDGSPQLERLEQSIFEWSRLVAGLTATDGAVVLDKRCGVLGFGAEVSGELPTPAAVYRALDTEAEERELDDIENVGTRHRAAYRFVNDHADGLAVVVSQDGGVTFVANRQGEVVFWRQSVGP
jgi:hypothetical protein